MNTIKKIKKKDNIKKYIKQFISRYYDWNEFIF
jgi:hypothetical protein